MELTRVSPTAGAICIALAHYRFLTINQMVVLKIASKDTLYKTLQNICSNKRNLVHRVRFGADGRGQMPDIFHLTRYGAEAAVSLGELPEAINYPARDYISRLSVPHNRAVVDCHIALDQWAKANDSTVEFCFRDFDPTDRMGVRKTSVQTTNKVLVPDMTFQLNTAGISRLCCLEMYRDESTTRVIKSLSSYPPALDKIREQYSYPHGLRVLAVFSKPSLIPYVIMALKNSAEEEKWEGFYFGSLEELAIDFRHRWQDIDGNQKALF